LRRTDLAALPLVLGAIDLVLIGDSVGAATAA
jgi:hypothetical protein